jgi:alpha-L-arabinofuranosidase
VGGRAKEAQGKVLTHSDMRATNTFHDPEEVKPASQRIKVNGDALQLLVPKQAVVLVECVLI